MSEHDHAEVNPGQAIYDALSEEAKAAVDALPNDVFAGEAGLAAASRFVESIRMADAINPDVWLISPDSRTSGRARLSLIVSATRLIHVHQRQFLAVRYDDNVLDERSREWLGASQLRTEAVLKTWPNLHRVYIPFPQLTAVPNGLWTAHEAAARILNQPDWHYSGDWHKDAWRIKLGLITGEALPAPSYLPVERYGLTLPPRDDEPVHPEQENVAPLSEEARAAIDALPDDVFPAEDREETASVFAEAIRKANDFGPSSWSLICDSETSGRGFLCLNVGNTNLMSLDSGSLKVVIDLDSAVNIQWNPGDEIKALDTGATYRAGNLRQFTVPWGDNESDTRSSLLLANLHTIQTYASKGWIRNQRARWHRDDWRVKLATIAGADIPAPGYLSEDRIGLSMASAQRAASPSLDLSDMLHTGFITAGLTYKPDQIASFYTALQTKGFVILSGISGTGKSKIAQRFAEMLPVPLSVNEPPASTVDSSNLRVFNREVFSYMYESDGFMIPRSNFKGLSIPDVGDRETVSVQIGNERHSGFLVTGAKADGSRVISLELPSQILPAFRALISGRTHFSIGLFVSDDGKIELVQLTSDPSDLSAGSHSGSIGADLGTSDSSNQLFLPVRPDWRDGKALIGYHNPLTGEYVRTPFLYFVLTARDDYRAGNRNAFFVILDEMNLAHVEYYFADVLSVIESGRDQEGWTVEGIRLDVGEDDPDLPKVLRLPPNLYIIGTVNMDETTHPFSNKVLDRAFTLELTEVDFTGYPPLPDEPDGDRDLDDDARQALLDAFTMDGRYPRIDKDDIRLVVSEHPRLRSDLQQLNIGLRRYRMHFGYRIFDEIMQFVANASRNGLFSLDAAFDHAVLMKVLPKFNGSRGRLQPALLDLLLWCRAEDSPSHQTRAALDAQFLTLLEEHRQFSGVVIQGEDTVEDNWRYPATGRRAALMMQDLLTDGFASYG